jgi:hypothetical protein
MYSSILKYEVVDIVLNIATYLEIQENQKLELQVLFNSSTEQNYFEQNLVYYEQPEGLAVGAPTSSLFDTIFIKHLEHNHVFKLLNKQRILAYYRYVDDILIQY